ncbi:gluconokinase [Burkholderia sp. WAC0059]|uniref:gluconokinase n=1 Tax=Burkholderia sp. WAC0059 TaxID=2066022 RepID=UPI000C7EC74E|nr:gluconokinase [Burkholderia sp. WAC0059]PLZ01043.1 gluconokinase [Burkholderia sp. WAC0059]
MQERQEPMSAIVVMGVAGCGKSSVATALAARLDGGRLIEGDAFHPAANVAKMRAGTPLDDADRAGWLARLADELRDVRAAGGYPVLACSALKRRYRDRLREAVPALGFVFLELTRAVAAERVASRGDHFMPASLVDNQFATLEPPAGEPLTLALDGTRPVADLVEAAVAWRRRHGAHEMHAGQPEHTI